MVIMEAGRHIRPHEKTAVSSAAEQAKRLAPRIKEYGGIATFPHAFELSDGRWAVMNDPVEFGYRIQAGPPDEPHPADEDWKMSPTDGVPIPREHFLDEDPPYGDPL